MAGRRGRSCGPSSSATIPYAPGQHRGIDIGAATGTPVRARSTATVTFAGTVAVRRQDVTIATADGLLRHAAASRLVRRDTRRERRRGRARWHGRPERARPTSPSRSSISACATSEEPQGYVDPLLFLPPSRAPAGRQRPAPEPRARARVGSRAGSRQPPAFRCRRLSAPSAEPSAVEPPRSPRRRRRHRSCRRRPADDRVASRPSQPRHAVRSGSRRRRRDHGDE